VTGLWRVVLLLVTRETPAPAGYMGSRCRRCGCGGRRLAGIDGGKVRPGKPFACEEMGGGLEKLNDTLELGEKYNKEMCSSVHILHLDHPPPISSHVRRT